MTARELADAIEAVLSRHDMPCVDKLDCIGRIVDQVRGVDAGGDPL